MGFFTQSTVYISITALFLLILKRIFKNKLSAKWQVYIWGILLIRFFVPLLPESEISVFNAVSNIPAVSIHNYEDAVAVQPVVDSEISAYDDLTVKIVFDDVAECVKSVGGIILFLYFISIYGILLFKVRKLNDISDNILSECMQQLKIKRKISLKSGGKTPVLIGFFKPKIILPDGYSESEKRDIIMHELCHFKNGDILMIWTAVLILCFNWFNPIIWYSFFVFRRDIEIYCDSRVLKYCENKKEYAELLLKTALSRNRFVAGTTSLQNGEKEVERRIKYIAYFKKPRLIWSVIIALTATGISAVCLTNENTYCNMSKDKIKSFSSVMVGSIMADIDYADNERVIFHYHDGIFVYNLNHKKIENAFDLERLNCSTFAQGDVGLRLQTDGKKLLLTNYGFLDSARKFDNYIIDIKTGKAKKTKKTELENSFSNFSDSFKMLDAYNDNESGWWSDNCVEIDGKLYYLLLQDGSVLEYVKIKVLDIKNRQFLEFYPFERSLYAKVVTHIFKEFRRVYSPFYEVLGLQVSEWKENGNEAEFYFIITYREKYVKKAKEPRLEKEKGYYLKTVLNKYENMEIYYKQQDWEKVSVDDLIEKR